MRHQPHSSAVGTHPPRHLWTPGVQRHTYLSLVECDFWAYLLLEGVSTKNSLWRWRISWGRRYQIWSMKIRELSAWHSSPSAQCSLFSYFLFEYTLSTWLTSHNASRPPRTLILEWRLAPGCTIIVFRPCPERKLVALGSGAREASISSSQVSTIGAFYNEVTLILRSHILCCYDC